MRLTLIVPIVLVCASPAAQAQLPFSDTVNKVSGEVKKAAGPEVTKEVERQVNAKLTSAGIASYKFEVSGHTDSTGKAEHNKELSGKRAAMIARELVKRGVPEKDIISIGMGAERPLVTPDNTPAKQAKNRRYEIQVRL